MTYEHEVDGSEFWPKFYNLPQRVRQTARQRYRLWRKHPGHHNLQFEKRCDTTNGSLWKINAGRGYRALALKPENGPFIWFWIGPHDEYERHLDRLC